MDTHAVARGVYAVKAQQGKPDVVGAVRAAGGEYAHFLFAAQARRANHLRPAFANGIVKQKLQPDVVKAV